MPIKKSIIDQTLATPIGALANRIVEILIDAGHDTWWVGGGVRDMLLDKVPKDIDVTTAAEPHIAIEILRKKIKRVSFGEAGIAYGSVFATVNGVTIEITTFREDDEASDGRHPESVTFGTRDADAARRDLTVNCIYFQPITQEVFDPYDGSKDLHEKLIRLIGEPAIRFKHDALRIVRTVRFRALLGGQYHPETFAALREQAALVEKLSGMRKLTEIEKMLMGPRPDRAFEDMWELGILPFIFPELHKCKGIPQPADYHKEGDVWDHTMQLLRSFKEEHGIDVRIAGLFHDAGKAETFSLADRIRFDHHASVSADLAKQALDRLQCPAKRRDKIVWIIAHHMMMGAFFDMSDERKAHWYYHPWFQELLAVLWLDIAGTTPADFQLYDRIVADYNRFLDAHPRPEKPLLSGADIMDILGIKAGERVGEILAMLHEAQVRKEITSKKEARDFVRSIIKNAARKRA